MKKKILVDEDAVQKAWTTLKYLRDHFNDTNNWLKEINLTLGVMKDGGMADWIPSLEQVRDAIHANHECVPGGCDCKCGCDVQIGCKLVFSNLCSVCQVRESRGDSSHGPVPPEPPK